MSFATPWQLWEGRKSVARMKQADTLSWLLRIHTFVCKCNPSGFTHLIGFETHLLQTLICGLKPVHTTGISLHSQKLLVLVFQSATLKKSPYNNTGCWYILNPTRKETNSLACQGRARFQQTRDANCYQVSFPARQGAEGNSRHSDRNISLFPSWWG